MKLLTGSKLDVVAGGDGDRRRKLHLLELPFGALALGTMFIYLHFWNYNASIGHEVYFKFILFNLYAYFIILCPKTRLVGIVDGLLLPLAHVISNLPTLLSYSHRTLSLRVNR